MPRPLSPGPGLFPDVVLPPVSVADEERYEWWNRPGSFEGWKRETRPVGPSHDVDQGVFKRTYSPSPSDWAEADLARGDVEGRFSSQVAGSAESVVEGGLEKSVSRAGWWARHGRKVKWGALGIGAIWAANRIFGKDDYYNTIEGMPEYGLAVRQRHALTDFGSGYRGQNPWLSPDYNRAEEVPHWQLMRASKLGESRAGLWKYFTEDEPDNEFLEATASAGTALHLIEEARKSGSGEAASVEKLVVDPENQITGHIDLVNQEGNPLDIKTLAPKRLEHVRKHGPFSGHVSQLNFYMSQLGADEGVLEYINREDRSDRERITVPFSPELLEADLARLSEVREEVVRGIASGELDPASLPRGASLETLREGARDEPAELERNKDRLGALERVYSEEMAYLHSLESARISGKDDAYNTIEGLRHGGMAERGRREHTDFGSGWQGLGKAVFLSLDDLAVASRRAGMWKYSDIPRAGVWLGDQFSGRDDNYNTIEGMSEQGFAARLRKRNTDFGSGFRDTVNAGKALIQATEVLGEREIGQLARVARRRTVGEFASLVGAERTSDTFIVETGGAMNVMKEARAKELGMPSISSLGKPNLRYGAVYLSEEGPVESFGRVFENVGDVARARLKELAGNKKQLKSFLKTDEGKGALQQSRDFFSFLTKLRRLSPEGKEVVEKTTAFHEGAELLAGAHIPVSDAAMLNKMHPMFQHRLALPAEELFLRRYGNREAYDLFASMRKTTDPWYGGYHAGTSGFSTKGLESTEERLLSDLSIPSRGHGFNPIEGLHPGNGLAKNIIQENTPFGSVKDKMKVFFDLFRRQKDIASPMLKAAREAAAESGIAVERGIKGAAPRTLFREALDKSTGEATLQPYVVLPDRGTSKSLLKQILGRDVSRSEVGIFMDISEVHELGLEAQHIQRILKVDPNATSSMIAKLRAIPGYKNTSDLLADTREVNTALSEVFGKRFEGTHVSMAVPGREAVDALNYSAERYSLLREMRLKEVAKIANDTSRSAGRMGRYAEKTRRIFEALDLRHAQRQQARAAISGGKGHASMKAGQSVTELSRFGGR